MTWVAVLPGMLVLAGMVVVPGWALLRLAGVRGLLALAGGPALSLAFYGLAAIGLDRAGVRWSWAPVLALLAAVCLVAAAVGLWVRRDARRRGARPGGADPAGLWSDRDRLGWAGWWVALAVAGSGLLVAVPIAIGMGSPGALLQQWDAVFHVNAVQAIGETGNASTFGAMQPMFGRAGAGGYYPAVWHGIVALAPGFDSIAAAANATTFVFGVLVWLVGFAGLGRVLFPRRWELTVATVVLASAFGSLQFDVLSLLAQWPYGAAMAAVPGTVALVVAGLRRQAGGVPLRSPARLVGTTIVLAGAAGGVALTHGSALFSLLVVVGPFVAVVLFRAGARHWHGNRRRLAWFGAGTIALVVVAVAVLLSLPVVQGLLRYERDTNTFFLVTVYRLLLDVPFAPVVGGMWPVAVCTVAGVVVLLRRRSPDRWLVASWALVLVLACLAAGPANPLRLLTGIWYSQATRIAAIYPVVAAPLAVVGLVALARWAERRLAARAKGAEAMHPARADARRLGAAGLAAMLVVTLGWHAPIRVERFEQAYVPGQILWGTMASAEEIELLHRLPATTPEDALILGDPANGAAFAWSVAGRRLVLPHLGESGMSPEQALLREGFDRLGEDPEICAAVRALGVTHYYQDTATTADGAKQDRFGPGLQHAPATGLEVVDSGGTATLYRITACD